MAQGLPFRALCRAGPDSLTCGRHFFGSFHTVPDRREIRYSPSGDPTTSRGALALVVVGGVSVPTVVFSAFVGSVRMTGDDDGVVSRGDRYTVSWSADRHSAVASFGLAA